MYYESKIFNKIGISKNYRDADRSRFDLNKIITAQEQTAAAFTRTVKKGIPSFSGCYAVSDSLKRLEIGSALSAPELLRIGKLLQTTARIKSYGRHENADDKADCLDVYF